MRAKDIEYKDLYNYYINQNHSRIETAEHFGLSVNTLRHVLERYGIKKDRKLVQELMKDTNIKRYGVDNPAKLDATKEKTSKTNKERYGVSCVFNNNEIREKIEQTNLERYGDRHPTVNSKVREKIRETNLEKYGCRTPFGNKDIQQKIKESLEARASAQREYYRELFNRILDSYERKITIFELAEQAGLAYSTAQRLVTELGLRDRLDIYYSYLEILFENILKELEVEYVKYERKVIKPYEIDFYLPNYYIGFEVNDNETHLGRREYHQLKRDMCREKGIDLYFIWQDQLLQDYENVRKDVEEIIALSR